jgi:phage-related protein
MPTFTWVPFYPPKVKDSYNVLTTEFESGKVQKRYKGRFPTQWTLQFKTSWAEMAAIRAFFQARRGGFEAFSWIDPWSGTSKTVRFASNELEIETEFKLNGIFTITFEEVL